jgi:TRAP-type C4-dicarboxylate transport system permease small subunit
MATATHTPPGIAGRSLAAVARPLDALSRHILIGSMIVMTVVVCAQVILRFAFSHSIDWADEISRLLFVWSMFLAIPHGIKHGAHVGIDALVSRMPENLRGLNARVMRLFCAGLCLIVVWMGIFVVREKWDELMPTIDITATVYYFPVIFAMFHSCVHFLILVVRGESIREDETS